MISGLILYWAWSWLMCLSIAAIIDEKIDIETIVLLGFVGWFPLLWIIGLCIILAKTLPPMDTVIWRKE